MSDFKIERIITQHEEIEVGYDLMIVKPTYLTSEEDCDLALAVPTDSSEVLLKRALQSPYGYIARYVLDADGLNKVDADYGNKIYEELSEGMTINTITRIKEHVNHAVLYSPEITVSDLEINLPDLDRLEIGLHYTINNEYKYITTDLPL